MPLRSFHEPFYLGAGVSALARSTAPVSLGGVGFLLDTTGEFVHRSVPLLRGSFDDSETPGGQTLNPEAFWRRTIESWHVGAGQRAVDRPDSDDHRFRDSKGVDVWERWELSLLPDTEQKLSSANANLLMAVAGSFLYTLDGNDIKYTSDVTVAAPTFTTLTGVPVNDPESIATDGNTIATAHGASGIYVTTRNTSSTAQQITGTVSHISYGKGRWIAAEGPSLYDVTTEMYDTPTVALPTAVFTQDNSDFEFNCFTDGPTAFYAGGFSGDKSLIYRLAVKEDGTGLDTPVVAGFLPDGETIQSMQGYLGFVLLGTSKGVRIGIPGGNGDLNIGAFIPTDANVQAFEGQEKFVWFGWTNYDSTDTGLGRIDLETFSDPDALAPAYASDLMATTQGAVQSVVTFNDLRVFTVSGDGMYAETTDLVSSGSVDSGLFNYRLADEKLALFVDVSHVEEGGTFSVALSIDRGTFASLGTISPSDNHPIGTGEARGKEFEVRLTLNRDSTDATVGPVIRDWTLRAQPASKVVEEIIVPFLLGPNLKTHKGTRFDQDPTVAFDHIVNLCTSKEIVRYAEADRSWSVVVMDYDLAIHDVWMADRAHMDFSGTCHTKLKVVT